MSINTLNITKQWRDRRNVLLLLVTCVTIPGFPCHRESRIPNRLHGFFFFFCKRPYTHPRSPPPPPHSPYWVLAANRLYSRYPPSLYAHKDWWNKRNVTWFYRWQTSENNLQMQDIEVEYVYSRQPKKKELFILKVIIADDRRKWSLLLFWIQWWL